MWGRVQSFSHRVDIEKNNTNPDLQFGYDVTVFKNSVFFIFSYAAGQSVWILIIVNGTGDLDMRPTSSKKMIEHDTQY